MLCIPSISDLPSLSEMRSQEGPFKLAEPVERNIREQGASAGVGGRLREEKGRLRIFLTQSAPPNLETWISGGPRHLPAHPGPASSSPG